MISTRRRPTCAANSAWRWCGPRRPGTDPAFIRAVRDLIAERAWNLPERAAIGPCPPTTMSARSIAAPRRSGRWRAAGPPNRRPAAVGQADHSPPGSADALRSV